MKGIIAGITHLAMLTLLAGEVSAQTVGGTNVELGVTVVELARQGDTTTVTYVLTIEPTSREALFAFTVETPTVLSVSQPMPPQDWPIAMRYSGFAVARWSVLTAARLAPGSETPELTFRAIGLPGIVDSRVTGHYERDVSGDGGSAGEEEASFIAHSSALRVVGVVRNPSDAAPRGLLDRMQHELEEACVLGWLNSQGACEVLDEDLAVVMKSLDEDANARRTAVRTLVERLEAFRGRSMGESAYQLFKANIEAVAERAER